MMDDNLLILMIYLWGFLAVLGVSALIVNLIMYLKKPTVKLRFYEGKLKGL